MIGHPCGHRRGARISCRPRRDRERRVRAARSCSACSAGHDGVREVLHLLCEPVGQPREPAHPHPHREVLALDVAGADPRGVGVAACGRRRHCPCRPAGCIDVPRPGSVRTPSPLGPVDLARRTTSRSRLRTSGAVGASWMRSASAAPEIGDECAAVLDGALPDEPSGTSFVSASIAVHVQTSP